MDEPAVRFAKQIVLAHLLEHMNKLIAVVGPSGAGKTALVHALAKSYPFSTAYEEHRERPFQALFKLDPQYALANQIDYLLLRAEQEKALRAFQQTGLIDGGLDLDFHGFSRLFRSRGLLSDPGFELCRRVYNFIRGFLPLPELIVRLRADEITIASRLSTRDRINIAGPEDTALFDSFLDEWLAGLPANQILELDVSRETLEYRQSALLIMDRIAEKL